MAYWGTETKVVQVKPYYPNDTLQNMSYADAAPPGFTGGHGRMTLFGNY